MQSIKNNKITRVIALALMICVICVTLLSAAFILTNANHEHDHNGVGGSCATCVQIHNSENLLKQLGTAIVITVLGLIGLFAALKILRCASPVSKSYTPVKLKTRLNN